MHKWDARDYHNSSRPQQTWALELLGKLNLEGSERILDLGCGDGKVTAEIAARVPRGSVVGLDLSDDMISFAREHFPPESHTNLRYVRGDASRLEFAAEFDVVYSNAALHWIRDHRPVLAGIGRALHRPGGRMLIQMAGRGNAMQVLALIDDLAREPKWGEYFRDFPFPYGFYGPEEYAPWLTEAGLAPRRVELIPRDMALESPEKLAAWIRTTWLPYTERIPQDIRGEFVCEIVKRFLAAHPADADGRIHVAMMRLEVEAIAET